MDTLLTLINLKSDYKLVRVGKPNKEKPRPLKVILPSEQDTRMFFEKCSSDAVKETDPFT